MRIIDPHIHMFARTTDDYERMAKHGIVAVVEPAFWLGSDRRYPESFFDYFAHLITFEAGRAAKYGLKHYTCVGINPKEANNLKLAMAVVRRLPEFLRHERVVAIGEIGFDKITAAEERVLRAQLSLAEETRSLVVIHSPHQNKAEGVARICRIIEEMKLTKDRILLDHNTEETIEITLDTGVWAGHTIYPVTKLTPARAVAILEKYGTRRMVINSSADWGFSDPLSVPKAAALMARRGFPDTRIKRVVFDNPCAFFAQSGKFAVR
ncbi:MAG: TatD family hydrolase [Planctomycetota bacterium]|nr:TatD family hydrolase [Planctomycetota bacterium]